jgi:ADP-ribosylation factor-like protein 1
MYSSFVTYMYPEYFVVVLGLDGAGKSALSHRMMYGSVTDTVPTCGFVMSRVKINNSHVCLVDMCGQDGIRPMWGVMYHRADGIIYVVDGTDFDRLSLSMSELKTVMAYPTLEDKPFLILINKQDDGGAVDCASLKYNIKGENWRMFNVSVKTGDGVDSALSWLEANLY